MTKPPAPLTHLAALVAGTIAMVVGASTFSWWRFSAAEGLGLREVQLCAFDSCKAYDYVDVVGSAHQQFATLGLVACYGAFAVAALALIAAVMGWQKAAVAREAARTTAVLALVMFGVAIAFVLSCPDELNLHQTPTVRARFFTHATSFGWSAIAYLAGAATVTIASALLSRRKS